MVRTPPFLTMIYLDGVTNSIVCFREFEWVCGHRHVHYHYPNNYADNIYRGPKHCPSSVACWSSETSSPRGIQCGSFEHDGCGSRLAHAWEPVKQGSQIQGCWFGAVGSSSYARRSSQGFFWGILRLVHLPCGLPLCLWISLLIPVSSLGNVHDDGPEVLEL